MTETFLVLFLAAILIAIAVGLYVMVAKMAKSRNRNVAVWLLLSFIATPILIAIILLCLGDAENETRNIV